MNSSSEPAATSNNANGTTVVPRESSEVLQMMSLVPTFKATSNNLEDNGDLKSRDSFLYFSNQNRRMAYLVHNEEDDADDGDIPAPQPAMGQRKTRISFEVHHSLLVEDFFLDMMEKEKNDFSNDIILMLAGREEEPNKTRQMIL
eukprot:CAMPEP_0172303636 /NCGR_PEP_ID=MMETSP1058-20130122/5154_1 /TAXON_ID=83371 /ORGANISM="Detonula confervacea, Strain CCMP 353" /LENGTH=144 /DNA_ID=CAMNT_0013014535 /DNA_START=15 /DNA_END=450 /DNA_ORIENTATION=-